MIFFYNNKTVDGKRVTNKEFNRLLKRELSEGRDVTMTNGQSTWTQYAVGYKGTESEGEMEEEREMERERERRGKEEREIAMMHEGQTVMIGRPTAGDGLDMTTGQTMTAGPMTLTDERTTVEEQATTAGQTATTGQTMTIGERTTVEELVTTVGQSLTTGQATTGQTMMTDIRTMVEELVMTVGQKMMTGQATTGQTMMIDERTMETPDEQTLTTEVLEEPGMIRDSDPETLPAEGVADISDVLTVDGQPVSPVVTEEAAMVVEVDPLAFASPGSGTPVRPTSCTSATPRSLFLTPVENTPSVSGRVHDMSVTPEDDVDKEEDIVARGPRVVGRKQVVVEDDVETLSSESSTSAGQDSSLASSSRVKGKGIKRGREVSKGKDCRKKEKLEGNSEEGKKKRKGKIEGSGEEGKKKRKGKGKVTGKKDTPEEELVGKCGEPMGIVQLALEDMSSSVLGGAMREWANQIDGIRVKSKNLQGKLSGVIKSCVSKIIDGTTLLVIRAEATGDPHFLRMRNSELASQLKETQRENDRLEEQLRRMGSGTPSPLRKRKEAKTAVVLDASRSIAVDKPLVTEDRVLPSSIREAFPPLPQRLPREMSIRSGGDRMSSVVRVSPPSVATVGSEGAEMGTEVYLTQQINALVAARELEREKKRREQEGREHVNFRDERKGVGVDKDKRKDKGGKIQDGGGKVGPRIISNVQLVPSYKERLKNEAASSSAMSTSETEWRVVGGRSRRKDKPPIPDSRIDPRAVLRDAGVRVIGDYAERRSLPKQQPKVRMPRPPLYSAVAITGRAEDFSYAEAMKNARKKIDLEALGIETKRVRKTLNGGLLIEVSGEGSRAKAEELVTRLRDVLKDSAIVSCPTKRRELRVAGFDESVSVEEITEALSKSGDCTAEEVKIGPIRTLNNGLGAVWVQLPVAAAVKVANLERLRLGWTYARVELLKARPLQCYRCWQYGHVQNTCRSTLDRRGACFKCGQQGHLASKCQNVAHCALCHDAGLETTHRLGGPQCMAQAQQA